MFSSREGAATTPLLSDLSAQRFSILYGLQVIFAADVFDGSILHLEALLGTAPAFVGIAADIDAQIGTLPGGGTVTDRWYSFSENGNGTISLMPQ